MRYVVVDCEATGLDVETVSVHCVVLQSPGEAPETFRPSEISAAISRLNELSEDPDVIFAGHNIIAYDFPILRRLGFKVPYMRVYDTLVVSKAAYPGSKLTDLDHRFFQKNPALRDKYRVGTHSLKSWGYRLGEYKLEYTGGFEAFSEDMLTYCVQDVGTNVVLLDKLRSRIPDEAALLECDVATICLRMEKYGVRFDNEAALELAVKLTQRRDEITKEMKNVFAPWFVSGGVTTPKRTQVSRKVSPGEPGYQNVVAGGSYSRLVLTEFNPASGEHIASRLQRKYGWKPKSWTDGGKVQITAEVLRDLHYPEAAPLAEYQELKKILGYLSEGRNAWLKLERNNRLHGKVASTGTVSGRAAHSNPNTGNVPTRSKLGHACRALFVASPGKVIVGADASGLQLRILGHYIAPWDDRAFAMQCEDPKGDIHEYLRAGTGLFTRDRQKTWTYSMFFGAQDARLGRTALDDHRDAFAKGLTTAPVPPLSAARDLGRKTRESLGNAIPAFPKLDKKLKEAFKRGELITLDGRSVPIGTEHIAIAMLLQGGEACIMKKAMSIAAPKLYAMGAEFILWVHDEFQVECRPDQAEEVGRLLVSSMTEAGEHFGLRVKIDGNYKIGKTWAETH